MNDKSEANLEKKRWWQKRSLEKIRQLTINFHDPYMKEIENFLYEGRLFNEQIQKKVTECGKQLQELYDMVLTLKLEDEPKKPEQPK